MLLKKERKNEYHLNFWWDSLSWFLNIIFLDSIVHSNNFQRFHRITPHISTRFEWNPPKHKVYNEPYISIPKRKSGENVWHLLNDKIIVDLYRKPTDRNQYLLTSSCGWHRTVFIRTESSQNLFQTRRQGQEIDRIERLVIIQRL